MPRHDYAKEKPNSLKDPLDKTFGPWTVKECVHTTKGNRKRCWICVCTCGNRKRMFIADLLKFVEEDECACESTAENRIAKAKGAPKAQGTGVEHLDQLVYDDAQLKDQISTLNKWLKKTVGLLPKKPTDREKLDLFPIIKKIEEVEEEVQLLKARLNFDTFAELVMTDDETGETFKQAPIHKKWTTLCSQYRHLIIWSHRASGKTCQVSIARTVWELGRDPTLRFLILSNTSEIAVRIVKAIANLIKNNATVRKIFPHLQPSEEGPWTNTQLKVVSTSQAKDPSVRAAGIHGSVTSARTDRVIIDDILDFENTSTEGERKKTMAWYKATVPGCLTRRSKVLIVGTAYHPADFIHEMSSVAGYNSFRFPLVNEQGTITWPALWSPERIEALRAELGPAEFARQALCKARDDGEARFKQEWIDLALEAGTGLPLIYTAEDLLREFTPEELATARIYTGVDLSTGKKKRKTDLTSFFTFLETTDGRRRVLMIEAGKFTGPEIIQRVKDNHERYNSTIAVEDNGSQAYIIQFASEGTNIPIIPHTTGKMKTDPILGIEGLAIELANGMWIIPRTKAGVIHPEVAAWINDMLFFDPKVHTGDRLMSCYFARELARRFTVKRPDKPAVAVRVIGEKPQEAKTETYHVGVRLKDLFMC